MAFTKIVNPNRYLQISTKRWSSLLKKLRKEGKITEEFEKEKEVAPKNLEMVGEFFKKIKSYFEHIFVISHNSLIRNWSDNLLMVKKEENVSSIDFITTRIS